MTIRIIKGAVLALVFFVICGFKINDAENKTIYGHEAKEAIEAIEAFGFTEVKIEGPAFYGCGKDYTIVTEFSAIGPRGHKVNGVVCGGILIKGWSVKIWKVEQPTIPR